MDVLRYIEDNYPDASLSEYAKGVGQPLYQRSRRITRQTGESFAERLRNRRLSRAGFVVRATNIPVEEIIPTVGYENTSYFYRMFKERHGITPREYRVRHSSY
jgi:YesN/AraC family two-component response regulator